MFLSYENRKLLTVHAVCDVTKGMVAPEVLQPGASFRHWCSDWRPDSNPVCCSSANMEKGLQQVSRKASNRGLNMLLDE